MNKIQVTFTEGGHWISVNVSAIELQSILTTGLLGENKLCAVRGLVLVGNKDLVYDFELMRRGKNPYRILNLSTGECE